jgi:fumarate hydratase class I
MDFDRLNPDSSTEFPKNPLAFIASEAFDRLSFTFTKKHLEHLVTIVNTETNTFNDRLVASMLLENAVIAAKGVYPLCQDTGTAQIFAWKDGSMRTEGDDIDSLSAGIVHTYTTRNLRFSTTIPSSLFDESDPMNNMPAQILIHSTASTPKPAYRFLFCAKGGGSSNKTAFIQGTKALLNEKSLKIFLRTQIAALGTAACPPYTIAVVVGGLSPEQNLMTLKLATAGYFAHDLSGWDYRVFGTRPLRDGEWEKKVLEIAAKTGLGAQFGGRSLASEAYVLRLPRHGASCPVSIGVSCSAHRNLHGYIDGTGVYLEKTVGDPLSLPGLAHGVEFARGADSGTKRIQPVSVDLDRGIASVRSNLSGLACGTPVYLTGTILVARDAAHARWRKLLEEGRPLPDYVTAYAILYAGPAQTPAGRITGSFGPTTAGRMDDYAEELMKCGAAFVTLAKGNRSEAWRKACRTYGATYLGTVGGAAALIAEKNIMK